MLFGLIGRKSLVAIFIILILLLVIPQLVSRFYVYLLAHILLMGLLAASLNMVLGFGGMYQFHHGVFFGMGAYAVALTLTRTDLPFWAAFLFGPLAAAALGFVMGLITVRLSKLYFGMLQISLGSLVWAVVFRWYEFTGGDDGIHGCPAPDLISSSVGAYYFILIVVSLCLLIMFFIVNSPFGKIFQGIRDNPDRSAAVGINVRLHQLIGQVVATFFGGVAGALFVFLEGSVFPDLLFWTLSLEILIMCLLGGWFTFLGPVLGAAVMLSLRTFVGIYTEYWTLVLGIVLMFLIFFLPQGILGWILEKLQPGEKKTEPGHLGRE